MYIAGLAIVIFVVSSDYFIRRYNARRKAREVKSITAEVSERTEAVV